MRRWVLALGALLCTGGTTSPEAPERVHLPLLSAVASYDYGFPGYGTRASPARLPVGPSWQVDRNGRLVQMIVRTSGPWEQAPSLGFTGIARVLWEIAPPAGARIESIGVLYRGGPFHTRLPRVPLSLALLKRWRTREEPETVAAQVPDPVPTAPELELLHDHVVRDIGYEVEDDPDARYLLVLSGESGEGAEVGATVLDVWYELE